MVNTPLTSWCLDAFSRRGEPATIRQIIGAIGRYVPSHRAIKMGRLRVAYDAKRSRAKISNYSMHKLSEIGKRVIVYGAIRNLFLSGRLKRLDKGLYTIVD